MRKETGKIMAWADKLGCAKMNGFMAGAYAMSFVCAVFYLAQALIALPRLASMTQMALVYGIAQSALSFLACEVFSAIRDWERDKYGFLEGRRSVAYSGMLTDNVRQELRNAARLEELRLDPQQGDKASTKTYKRACFVAVAAMALPMVLMLVWRNNWTAYLTLAVLQAAGLALAWRQAVVLRRQLETYRYYGVVCDAQSL